MNVILLEKVANLGNLGDQVKVKAGYGRNFLVPFGKAVPATKSNVEAFEAQRAELEKKAQEKKVAAEQRAESLTEKEITISAKAGDGGKLYGSIGTRDLAEVITAQLNVKVQKSEVQLPTGLIRTTGEHLVTVALHSDVTVDVKVVVVSE